MKTFQLAAVSLCAAALAFQGCASAEKKPDEATTSAASKEKTEDKAAEKKLTAEADPSEAAMPDVRPVYFSFNSSELTPDGQQALKQMASYLERKPDARVVLEGHADERGTEEYNLALGQRRAEVMRGYLERLGVKDGQIRTVSYGELKPAVEGSDEEAWTQNRRGEFKLDGVGRRG